jgi:hypothetical protein
MAEMSHSAVDRVWKLASSCPQQHAPLHEAAMSDAMGFWQKPKMRWN